MSESVALTVNYHDQEVEGEHIRVMLAFLVSGRTACAGARESVSESE